LDSKFEKCIFIGYKDGLKGYKLWKPVTWKVVYNRDVVFKEVKDVIKHEVQPKEPEKIEFELKEEESNSIAEEESEDEEPQTLGVRRSVQERRQLERYSPSAFYSNFSLSLIDDDPRAMKEVIYSEDGKLWKEAMVDEIESLHKMTLGIWWSCQLEGNPLAANGCSRRRQMQKERWINTKLIWSQKVIPRCRELILVIFFLLLPR